MNLIRLILLTTNFILACSVMAQEAPTQTLCPLMVDDVTVLQEFVVFKGVKVFMCCGSCKETWDKNPKYFAVVCQEQAPQLKVVASKEIKPLKQLFCPVYATQGKELSEK